MLNTLLLAIGIGLLLAAFAVVLLLLNERRFRRTRLTGERRRALGLPEGDLVYDVADGQGETLSSSIYPLAGKPDYVVKLPDGRLVPVELKLNVHDATAPHSNHTIQVAAYCLILEDYFVQAPTHGILRYADREFTLEYTSALRKKVIRLLTEMAKCSEQQPPPLSSHRASKCLTCTSQPICPILLTH